MKKVSTFVNLDQSYVFHMINKNYKYYFRIIDSYEIKIGKKVELLVSDFRIQIESEYIFDPLQSTVTFNNEINNKVSNDNREINTNLKISVVDKRDLLKKIKRYDFSQSKEVIKFGRDSESLDICLNNEDVSNLHFRIIFDKSKSTWIIKDGNGKKLSSNGTWMLIQEYYEIPKNRNTYFRYENKVFMAYYDNDI